MQVFLKRHIDVAVIAFVAAVVVVVGVIVFVVVVAVVIQVIRAIFIFSVSSGCIWSITIFLCDGLDVEKPLGGTVRNCFQLPSILYIASTFIVLCMKRS